MMLELVSLVSISHSQSHLGDIVFCFPCYTSLHYHEYETGFYGNWYTVYIFGWTCHHRMMAIQTEEGVGSGNVKEPMFSLLPDDPFSTVGYRIALSVWSLLKFLHFLAACFCGIWDINLLIHGYITHSIGFVSSLVHWLQSFLRFDQDISPMLIFPSLWHYFPNPSTLAWWGKD